MNAINPYVGFNGKCREAMTFYKECFGGELDLQEVAGSPFEQHWSGPKDQIFHSALSINGALVIMGSDMSGPGGHIKGNNVSLAISCSSGDEINDFFNKLAEGGKVLDPLRDQFWGAIFGAVQDRFSVNWMLNYDRS